jgi:AcrR family transcriptional regulator
MLNMRLTDDRTTAARIRDAAIECFAEGGVAATSIRAIATGAGVSAGLVIHYFGSKEDLRTACDQYVAAAIREMKSEAMETGASFDPLEAWRRRSGGPPITRYLAKTLGDGSPHVAAIVDEMAADATAYLEIGVATGMVTPSQYPNERAAILTIWSLGALVLHEHLERLIGVDITRDLSDDPKAAGNYVGAAVELATGFITDATREMMASAFVDAPEQTEKEDI